MPVKSETVAEMNTTIIEYTGVEVRLSLPWAPHTITTRKAFDSRQLELLRDLEIPEEAKYSDTQQSLIALREWEQRNKEAKDFVDWLAKGIALDICHFTRKVLEGRQL